MPFIQLGLPTGEAAGDLLADTLDVAREAVWVHWCVG